MSERANLRVYRPSNSRVFHGTGRGRHGRGGCKKVLNGTARSTARPRRPYTRNEVLEVSKALQIALWVNKNAANRGDAGDIETPPSHPEIAVVGFNSAKGVSRAVGEVGKSSTERSRHPCHGCRGTVATVTGGSPR
ncbi:hypothetical protein B0H12DRAFT_1220730 [Mycena haematopus]|nr:hypothetical protein B0H12DRAFT_1220730 [Mycena haematopus]